MKWIISVLLCVAFAASLVLFVGEYNSYEAAKAEVISLGKEVQDYKALVPMYEAQEKKVAAINELWGELENSGLEPSEWATYPLQISKTIDWNEVNKLMIMASNKYGTADEDYLFRPDSLRLERVQVEPDARADQEGGAEVIVGAVPMLKYNLSMRGAFLIHKAD